MGLMPTGTLAALGLGLSVAAGAGGYFHGLDVGRQRERAATRKDIDAAIAARDRLRTLIEQAALKHLEAEQARQSNQREIVRESERIVERPVYRSVCVDADGVRLLDRAAANANGEPSAASAGAAGGAAAR